MKSRIFIIILLILSVILNGAIESYAAEAHAYASVLIIIPPKEEKTEENTPKEKEEPTYAKKQVNESEETQKD